jgi:hypothetical protein
MKLQRRWKVIDSTCSRDDEQLSTSARLKGEIILWVVKVRIIGIALEELGHFVRIDIVRVDWFIFARDILGLVALFGLIPEDACPLTMEQLTSSGLTDTGVAEVWAFEDMAIGAVCTLVTVSTESKCRAYGGTWRGLGVSKGTVRPGALSLGKVQTVRNTFWGKLMGEIAGLAIGTLAVFQEILAKSHLVRIMDVSAGRAFRTGT